MEKNMKSKPFAYLLSAMLLAGSGVCAESPTPVSLTLQDTEFDVSKGVVTMQIRVDHPEEIMGAAFTVAYDTKHLQLTAVDSSFFDTFKNQFTAANATNKDLEKTTVAGVTHTRPLIMGDRDTAAGGNRIAAVRVQPETDGNKTLFTLSFAVQTPKFNTALPVRILPSVITNTAAGYKAEGEALPLLITQTQNKKFPALPVKDITTGSITMVDHSQTPVTGTLRSGDTLLTNTEITFYSPLTGETVKTVTDKEGHFTVPLSQSAITKPLEIRVTTEEDGTFHAVASVSEGTLTFQLPNTPPEQPVILPLPDASPLGLTPQFTTQDFYDENYGHGQTHWQILNTTRLAEQGLTLADCTDADGSISENRQDLLVFQIQSTEDLTALTVPEYTLDTATDYAIRARFYDTATPDPMASSWSAFVRFTTKKAPQGTTLVKGVLMPEDQAMSSEEMDIFDGNVIGIHGPADAIAMGISQPEKATIGYVATHSVSELGQAAQDAMPEALEMPYGIVGFNLSLAGDGDADVVRVPIQFDMAVPEDLTWWKFNRSENRWIDYTEHATFADDRMSVEIELKDGDFGDFDGVKNGRIVDPGGLGTSGLDTSETHSDSCYIQTAANNGLSGHNPLSFVGVLSFITGFFGFRKLRKATRTRQ